jgi:predicted nucleotidyltransferase
MIQLVENKMPEFRRVCLKYKVARSSLFGSAATGEFQPGISDLDFVVEFQKSSDTSLADQYFGLLEDLQRLFGCDVHLATKRSIRNPYLLLAINETGRALYAAEVS